MKFFIAIFTLVFSVNTLALGKNEEQVLKFLGGMYVLEKLHEHEHRYQPPYRPQYRPHQRYYDPAMQRAYEEGVYQRYREQEDARRRAWECGYTGRC